MAVEVAGARRVRELDVLRGFAVLGILVVNIGVFADPGGIYSPAPATGVDAAVRAGVQAAATAKFYVLFSLLFGYGLAVQSARGAPLGRLARRLAVLAVLGALHAVLLFPGDILVVYAVAGLLVLPLRRVRAVTALRLGAALLAVIAVAAAAQVAATALADAPSDAARAAEYAGEVLRAYQGSPGEVLAQRVRDLQAIVPVAAVAAVPLVLAYLLLGLAAGRAGLLDRELPPSLLRRVCVAGLVLGAPPAVFSAWAEGSDGAVGLAGTVLGNLTAPALTAAYAAAVLLAGRTGAGRRVHAALVPVGRMSLTNYLAQSVVCALLFTGYGFALAGRVGPAGAVLVAVGVLAVQVPLSAWWLRRHRHGPVEWLLRSASYARVQPWRR